MFIEWNNALSNTSLYKLSQPTKQTINNGINLPAVFCCFDYTYFFHGVTKYEIDNNILITLYTSILFNKEQLLHNNLKFSFHLLNLTVKKYFIGWWDKIPKWKSSLLRLSFKSFV